MSVYIRVFNMLKVMILYRLKFINSFYKPSICDKYPEYCSYLCTFVLSVYYPTLCIILIIPFRCFLFVLAIPEL